MTDVRIGSKVHKNIERLTIGKLEHLIQLAEVEIKNYQEVIVNYPPERMKRSGEPYLKELRDRRDVLVAIKEYNFETLTDPTRAGPAGSR